MNCFIEFILRKVRKTLLSKRDQLKRNKTLLVCKLSGFTRKSFDSFEMILAEEKSVKSFITNRTEEQISINQQQQ